jgi:hypothetical protein
MRLRDGSMGLRALTARSRANDGSEWHGRLRCSPSDMAPIGGVSEEAGRGVEGRGAVRGGEPDFSLW